MPTIRNMAALRLRTTLISAKFMSKTLVANPVAGLSGVPARIILDKKGLTIKNGLLGSKSFPYSSIESVSFTGANSLTLSGSIVIVPWKGSQISLLGFYRNQFKQVQQAVSDGYYEDSMSDDDINNSSQSDCHVSDEVTIAQIKAQEKEAEREAERKAKEAELEAEREKREAEREEREAQKKASEILSIQQFDIETSDSDIMVKKLNHLIGIIDSTKGDVKKAALSKYNTQFEYLKSVAPSHPMLKMFKSKYKKSKKVGCIIAIVVVILLALIIL